MVQFNLPQNSKIVVGEYFKDKKNSSNLKKVNIYRWDPSSGKNPRIDTFEVDMDNCGPKVLDILFKIKNEIDTSLTFRRSCAHGVCGSCAMNVDGVNTLSCIKSHTDIKGDLNIYPLPHVKNYFNKLGYSHFEYLRFDIDIDLPKPKSKGMATYTEMLKNGRRIQISSGILMNWYFILARK